MDQDRRRRGGAVDSLNQATSFIQGQGTRLATRAAVAAVSGSWIPFVIVGVVIFLIVFIVLFGGEGGGVDPGSAQPAPPDVVIPPPASGSMASCPVEGGRIVTASYQVDPVYGHCGSQYGACNPNSRRAKSIDVSALGKDVVLPTVQGQVIYWKFLSSFRVGPNDCGDPNPDPSDPAGRCGIGYVFSSDTGWYLHLLHMKTPSFTVGQRYPSGTIAGRVTGTHVHVTIGKDLQDQTGMAHLDPGWLSADRDVGMCVVRDNNASNTCTQPYEATGHCSPQALMPYFDNDSKRALIASLICNAESGGNPLALNTNCATNDYSVGLFQINAVAHCSGAFGNLSCSNLLSAARRDACVADWSTVAGNLAQAKRISGNGSSWTAWGTWAHAGKIPPVRDILTRCGIQF
jgi:hypothetical protein